MGIEINGKNNTIKKVSAEGVFTYNYLIINGTEYEWPSGTGDVPPTPIEPSEPTIKSKDFTFELWSPSQTESSYTDYIPITKDPKKEDLDNGTTVVASYIWDYINGSDTYEARLQFTAPATTEIIHNGEQLPYITNADGTITTKPESFRLWEFHSTSKFGFSGASIKTITCEYLTWDTQNAAVMTTRSISEPTIKDSLSLSGSLEIGNTLGVYGSINGLNLYYDIPYVDIKESEIGFGFFAKFYESHYIINSEEYTIPFFQLSPGMVYSNEHIQIEWRADGKLIAQGINNYEIESVTFAPEILRYE